jgi:hypothetical protein
MITKRTSEASLIFSRCNLHLNSSIPLQVDHNAKNVVFDVVDLDFKPIFEEEVYTTMAF